VDRINRIDEKQRNQQKEQQSLDGRDDAAAAAAEGEGVSASRELAVPHLQVQRELHHLRHQLPGKVWKRGSGADRSSSARFQAAPSNKQRLVSRCETRRRREAASLSTHTKQLRQFSGFQSAHKESQKSTKVRFSPESQFLAQKFMSSNFFSN